MHTMATYHGSAGCPVDRDIDLHIEDTEITGIENDNESISGSDTTMALIGPEAEGHPDESIPRNHAMLTALTRETNELHKE